MVIEQNTFNKKDFLDLFQKRFFSFCEKSPLFLRFTILDDCVLVYDLSTDPEACPLEFKFDFSKNEKVNIKIIKDYLMENNYPVITITNEQSRSPTALEIQECMHRSRLSFSEASKISITKKTVREYRVEKILNTDNRVIIRDLDNDTLDMYSVRIPVTIFNRELFNNIENATDIFIKKCKKIKSVLDKQKALQEKIG